MLRPQGYGQIVDPGGVEWERDSISCGHCTKVVWVKPGSGSTTYLILHHDPLTGQSAWTEEPGAFCRSCMRPVCLPCHDVGTCTPLERWLEQQEKAGRLQVIG